MSSSPLRAPSRPATRPHLPARALALGLAAWALAGSCLYVDDPYYCEGMPNDYCHQPACTTSDECDDGAPVCDVTGGGVCVQCTGDDAGACAGATPVCGDDRRCRPCSAHADCASAACLPDGSCGDEALVAYVTQDAPDSAPCALQAPCGSVARGLATGRPYLKLRGRFAGSLVFSAGRKVTLLGATGAQLSAEANAAIITARDGGTEVTLHQLTLADASGDAGYGLLVPPGAGAPTVHLSQVTVLNNQAGGLSVAGGALTISRSTFLGNAGGGLMISGNGTTFQIGDSVFAYNGRALGNLRSPLGGVAITANSEGSRFERNTVVFNESDGITFRGGVSCNAPMATAAGNLIYHNVEPDGIGGLKNDLSTQRNPAPSCAFADSLALAAEPGNLGFRSPVLPPLDFHLTAASPPSVRDAGGACTGTDLDGDGRPQGGACDLGADEYRP
jgi:Right handed beta helix region